MTLAQKLETLLESGAKASDLATRTTVFISKATPGDDEFVLWLAPKLEAAGYEVFADILNLQPGDRWRKEVTAALQSRAIKMLLCCQDSSLDKNGVQEEIAIAEDLSKQLGDARFILPLRLAPFKKVFGIGGLQYIDFVGSWAQGLSELLDALNRQGVPRAVSKSISPHWEMYRQRFAIEVAQSPEELTTSWLRVSEMPDVIRYYQPTGALDHSALERAAQSARYPAEVFLRGFYSFATPGDVQHDFESAGRFALHSEVALMDFLDRGSKDPDVGPREAKNLVSSIFRRSWESYCAGRGLRSYPFSKQLGFHITENQASIGKRIRWGAQQARRSSMLCNIAAGRVWQYGVSVQPQFWPFPHFKVKARVLFSQIAGKNVGEIFAEADQQHRFRRNVCKGWRNKQWHGRLMAFLEVLAGGSPQIDLVVSEDFVVRLHASPLVVTAPVTTVQIDDMAEDGEEQDDSTLGNFHEEGDDQ